MSITNLQSKIEFRNKLSCGTAINTDLLLDAVGVADVSQEMVNYKILERVTTIDGAAVKVNSFGQAEVASEISLPVVQLLGTAKECARPMLTKELRGIKTLSPIKYITTHCINADDGFLMANGLGSCDEQPAQFFANAMAKVGNDMLANERATVANALYGALRLGQMGGYFQDQNGFHFSGTDSYVPSFDFTTGTYVNVPASFNLTAGAPVTWLNATAEDIRSYLHKVTRTLRPGTYEVWLNSNTMDCLRKIMGPMNCLCDPNGTGAIRIEGITFYEVNEVLHVPNGLGGVDAKNAIEDGELFIFFGTKNFQMMLPKHTIPEKMIEADGTQKTTPIGQARSGRVFQFEHDDCGGLKVGMGNYFFLNALSQTMAYVKTDLICQ